ncbi:hypothetical protein [Streptomyces spiramyceticus]|uniref:hypothetical protein n=1 Tax=Streptomyces spiramyceticus TaxID=299717 RepID=UPI00237A90BC|nr:hypothetical protein [Streptomyces spiramyceticus]
MFWAGKQGQQGKRRARRQGAAVAVAGVVFAGAVACGGSNSGTDKDGKNDGKPDGTPTASAGKAASGPKPLTEAQLTAAAFTDGESVGKYTASEFTLGGPNGEEYTADPAVCQPFVSLADEVTDYELRTEVNRRVDVPDEMLGLTVSVQLRSYANGDAARVMKDVAKAGKECADGFTEERAIAKGKYLKVEPVKAPDFGDGADEARAYHFTILDVKGKLKLHEYLTVVRAGSATLSFRGEIIDTKDIGGVPKEVLDAQWEKFEAAVGTK